MQVFIAIMVILAAVAAYGFWLIRGEPFDVFGDKLQPPTRAENFWKRHPWLFAAFVLSVILGFGIAFATAADAAPRRGYAKHYGHAHVVKKQRVVYRKYYKARKHATYRKYYKAKRYAVARHYAPRRGYASRQYRAAKRYAARVVSNSVAAVSGAGSSVLATAKRYLGTNPTGMRALWCARFVNQVLAKHGKRGTGSDMAKSFVNYGTRVAHAQPGDIVVSNRRGGGHVGIFSHYAGGRPILVNGNYNGRVAMGAPPGQVVAIVRP